MWFCLALVGRWEAHVSRPNRVMMAQVRNDRRVGLDAMATAAEDARDDLTTGGWVVVAAGAAGGGLPAGRGSPGWGGVHPPRAGAVRPARQRHRWLCRSDMTDRARALTCKQLPHRGLPQGNTGRPHESYGKQAALTTVGKLPATTPRKRGQRGRVGTGGPVGRRRLGHTTPETPMVPQGTAPLDGALMDVTPTLARLVLQRDGDGMVGLLIVRLGVLIGGVVGAGHPAAGQAEPQRHPAFPAIQALQTASRVWLDRAGGGDVVAHGEAISVA
jgi:hypothetical protein